MAGSGRSLEVQIKVETRLLEAGTLVIVIPRRNSKHPAPTAVSIHGHYGVSAIANTNLPYNFGSDHLSVSFLRHHRSHLPSPSPHLSSRRGSRSHGRPPQSRARRGERRGRGALRQHGQDEEPHQKDPSQCQPVRRERESRPRSHQPNLRQHDAAEDCEQQHRPRHRGDRPAPGASGPDGPRGEDYPRGAGARRPARLPRVPRPHRRLARGPQAQQVALQRAGHRRAQRPAQGGKQAAGGCDPGHSAGLLAGEGSAAGIRRKAYGCDQIASGPC